MNNNNQKKLNYKGTNISYQLYKSTNNDKPYLIFIHGFLSSQFSFRKMIPLLSDQFNIITVDLPPFGDSDRIKSFEYSYKNMADLIIFFMDYFKINSAYLLGHSMGGQIALTCAYHYPDRIKQLILLAPSCYMIKADYLSYYASYIPFFRFFLRKLMKKKGVYEMIRQTLYHDELITEEMIETYKAPFLDSKMYICLTKMIRDREGDLSVDCIRNIKTKCLLFWGKYDEILPISTAYQMAKDLLDVDLCTFDYAGHLLCEEVPHVICDRILAQCQ
ncbi:alpha/beta hydrolase [Aquibacillus koreensis]|uniref:Alpha/beta hydrolase n=1 Tax=Aquibacillus koreensis TaxID=279446 RepID=A0A9X3WKJ7_9BACI|nr:alpha/beta hydrolase [Aquibacillus koreensis]MCT2535862.1 alpha/beta hydrolase [Aquibacillus koreensis]MDC3420318.1 alpha/beta hydrolase [Aquibacillus koreensis]